MRAPERGREEEKERQRQIERKTETDGCRNPDMRSQSRSDKEERDTQRKDKAIDMEILRQDLCYWPNGTKLEGSHSDLSLEYSLLIKDDTVYPAGNQDIDA